MLTHDFVVVSHTATIGDTFNALVDAGADVNWYVIVAYPDHYGAVRAGQLAKQALAGRSALAALQTNLRDLDIPTVEYVLDTPLAGSSEMYQLALVLDQARPSALIYRAIRSFDPEAGSAFDELTKAVTASTQHANTRLAACEIAKDMTLSDEFIVVPEKCTVGDVLDVLEKAGGDTEWYVIVATQGRYAATRAARLARQALTSANQAVTAALKLPLADLEIPAVNVATTDSRLDKIRQFTLVLENNLPVSLIQSTRRSAHPKQTAYEQLMEAAPKAVPKSPVPSMAPDVSFSPSLADREETPRRTTDAHARYVNTWFTDLIDGKPLSNGRGLVRRKLYWLQLHIGPLLEESIIIAPRPIDPDLPSIPDEGLLLRVKLFSHDFEIENDTHQLRLYASGATERLHIALTAPDTIGEARLRAGIYYQNNLVQSFLFHAWVDEHEWSGRGNRAVWAEVEYSLSEDLADITQLQPRRVNIFVNDSPDGTHMVGVVGTPTEGALSIGRDKMKEAVTEFRARLLTIVMDEQQKYRYGPDNAGGKDQFIDDLKTLAYLGNALFRSVFYRDETIDFTRDLRQALAGPQPAVIQVARLSSDFVFPWAGIYDQRLTVDRGSNQVCLKPLQQATPAAALDTCNACLQQHAQDPNTICLSGFWGFRHIVEQPLSVVKKGQPTSIVREIKASGTPAVSMNVYTGDDFKLRSGHQAWIDALIQQKAGKLIFSDRLEQVKRGLPQPQQLCYFYCHGGSSPTSLNPWLTVGQDERFMPPDLYGIALEEGWRFQNVRPLVLINACHSIEFTPEALSAFLPEFATAGASGIIGTEVSVFEPLAVEFGQGLIQAFLDGEPIGPAVQRLRWQLLLKYNALGLVYTPYCYADLCLVSNSA